MINLLKRAGKKEGTQERKEYFSGKYPQYYSSPLRSLLHSIAAFWKVSSHDLGCSAPAQQYHREALYHTCTQERRWDSIHYTSAHKVSLVCWFHMQNLEPSSNMREQFNQSCYTLNSEVILCLVLSSSMQHVSIPCGLKNAENSSPLWKAWLASALFTGKVMACRMHS